MGSGLVGASERVEEGEERGLHSGFETSPRVEAEQHVVEKLAEDGGLLACGLGELGEGGDDRARVVRRRDAPRLGLGLELGLGLGLELGLGLRGRGRCTPST